MKSPNPSSQDLYQINLSLDDQDNFLLDVQWPTDVKESVAALKVSQFLFISLFGGYDMLPLLKKIKTNTKRDTTILQTAIQNLEEYLNDFVSSNIPNHLNSPIITPSTVFQNDTDKTIL